MSNENLHMSLPIHYSIDEEFDNDKFVKLRLDFAHDGINPNHTRFTKEILESKKKSLFLSPILGHITQTDDSYEFNGHDMEFRPNPFQNNKMQMFYLENILGIIPPENMADFEIKEVDGRNRVFVNGYLYKGYSNFAEDILRQADSNPISMEIDILQYSFDVKENVYDVLDFKYTGITFLNQEAGTGMIGANSRFFAEEKDIKEQMVIMLRDFKETFGLEVDNKIFEEGGLGMVDIEHTEGVAADTVEAPDTVVETSDTTTENDIEIITETPSEEVVETPILEESDVKAEAVESFEQVTEGDAVTVKENLVRTFEISHEDIRYGLYALLSNVEAENNEWYYIEEVFDTYFDYCNEFNKHFRQNYSKDEAGNVQFVGERFEVFVEKLTAEEKTALDVLRNNYEAQTAELKALREFKAKYDFAEKQAVIGKWEAKIGKYAEFDELKETFAQMSVEDIETKCKCIFADNIAFTGTFSAIKKNTDFTPVSVPVRDTTEVSNGAYNGFIEEFSSK